MESQLLDLAYQQQSWAQGYIKNDRYDEAIQCHHNATELLVEASHSTNSSEALEYITLQHSFNLKQIDIIKCQKECYARTQKAIESNILLGKELLTNLQGTDYSKLNIQISNATYESKLSFLNILSKNFESLIKDATSLFDNIATVKEEVQDLCSHNDLDPLMEQLSQLIEVYKEKNKSIKERVAYLENERVIEEEGTSG